MLTDINPKLPMRNKAIARDFYLKTLGFQEFGSADFEGYLMVQKDRIQIHFFEFIPFFEFMSKKMSKLKYCSHSKIMLLFF